uniref:Uncharacterized protein n=1 Tax=Knipowitschia caucasica TaxID=637954 RepID=A0AAV2M617_KNICA
MRLECARLAVVRWVTDWTLRQGDARARHYLHHVGLMFGETPLFTSAPATLFSSSLHSPIRLTTSSFSQDLLRLLQLRRGPQTELCPVPPPALTLLPPAPDTTWDLSPRPSPHAIGACQ